LGAVAAGFLFRSDELGMQHAFFLLGSAVVASSALVLLVRFAVTDEEAARLELERARAASTAVPVAAE
jgi:hypothetical protein